MSNTYVKLYNNIEDIYNVLPINDNAYYYCPVCGKKYKTKKPFDKHLEKRNCHNYVDIFRDTITEEYTFEAFKELKGKNISLSYFRRSRVYKPLSNIFMMWSRLRFDVDLFSCFILYLEKKKKKDNDQYFKFLFNVNDYDYKSFRKYLRKNEHLIDSETFYNRNKYHLQNDTTFFLKSIRRGDIGIEFAVNHLNMEKLINHMTGPEIEKLNNYIDEVTV